MIEIKNLSFSYGQKTLHFPDFSCASQEKMLILGNSGRGKTTLLHLLAGLLRPQKGEIWIAQQNINLLSKAGLDLFRGQNIGIVFQKNYFVQSLSVLENLLLAPFLAQKKVDKSHALGLLQDLGLQDHRNAKAHQLSQGEQQRLSICRAIINQPKIILADEPSSALDDHNCQEVLSLLATQSQKYESTLVVVTHDQRLKEQFDNKLIL